MLINIIPAVIIGVLLFFVVYWLAEWKNPFAKIFAKKNPETGEPLTPDQKHAKYCKEETRKPPEGWYFEYQEYYNDCGTLYAKLTATSVEDRKDQVELVNTALDQYTWQFFQSKSEAFYKSKTYGGKQKDPEIIT